MPMEDELTDRLGSAKYLSILDLSKGYWQVPMAEDSKALTAFSDAIWIFPVLFYAIWSPGGASHIPAWTRCWRVQETTHLPI